MPDYPYIYGSGPLRPVSPGGTRVRLFRRRQPADQGQGEQSREEGADEEDSEWRSLLSAAVSDLNASLRHAGAPYSCALEEDAQGFSLRLLRLGSEPGEPGEGWIEEVDEVLAPTDLPRWLSRICARLGIFLDEKV